MSITKDEVLLYVLSFIEKHYRFPTEKELVTKGYTRDIIRNRFGSISGMKESLVQESFLLNYIDESVFNGEYNAQLQKKLSKKKVFIISSFVCGSKVSTKLLKNLKTLASHYKGELLLMPILDKKNKTDKFFDPVLVGENILTTPFKFNNNIETTNTAVSARSVDPTTGLPRLGQRQGSTIIASTKQRLVYVPTGSITLPHAIMSTGTITEPHYLSNAIFKSKDARIAEEDHKFGAIVLEIEDNKHFHFRHVEAGSQMEIIDLGTRVHNGRVSSVAPSAMVLGDWHSGKTNKVVAKETEKLSKKLRINRWVLHDAFDGDAINHHDQGKHLTRAKKALMFGLSLAGELAQLADDLKGMSSYIRDIIIVRSNHDEFLDLYLNTAKYVEDPNNHALALKLASAMLEGDNPLQVGTEMFMDSNLKNKVTWLKTDESYKIADIELGHHGSTGANGARPSIKSLENAFKKAVTAHSHTPQILRDMWVVGTSTDPFPDYGKGGPNSWMNTHCLVYSNGSRQLINLVNSKFTTLWK